jgi:hypothetical protein
MTREPSEVRYRITLSPTNKPGDPPAHIRLRQALKVLLRRFGLRAIEPIEATPVTPPPSR